MSNQIEFRHLRYFIALSQELHFRKAAEKLFISQPGLSRQIQQLEGFLGAKLVNRTKRKVELTQAGHFFKIEAEYLVNGLEKMLKRTNEIAEGRDGDIKIGFVGSAMQNVIPDLIVTMNQLYPGIHFSFEELSNEVQIKKLKSNEIDIGFVRLDQVDEDLDIRPIFEDTFSLVLPVDHPICEENFVNMKQLETESFILFQQKYSPAYYKQVISICEDQGFLPNIVHNSVHASTIFKLVENKLGVSIIPTTLKNGFDMKIKFIELSKIPQKAMLSYTWNRRNRNPALNFVLDCLKPC